MITKQEIVGTIARANRTTIQVTDEELDIIRSALQLSAEVARSMAVKVPARADYWLRRATADELLHDRLAP